MGDANHLDSRTQIRSIKQVVNPDAPRNACLVEIYGPNIGRRLEMIDAVITLGRDFGNTVVLEGDSVSRRHARIELRGNRHWVIDNRSTNGTYLNDKLVAEAEVLTSGDFVKIGDAIFKYLTGDNIERAYYEEIYRMTIEDGLTRIANKRALDDFLEKEFARARRYNRKLSVVIFDIDLFKNINDTYGHLMGDYVLREMAAQLKPRIRREEMLARYGGEEFCVVLPETELRGAVEFAESLRKLVEETRFQFESNDVRVTISAGVAVIDDDLRPEELIKRADDRLYDAKHSGRNRVCS